MTKILFTLRHAQSADKQSTQQDYDRVLTPWGESDSIWLGKKLSQQSIRIDLIVSSAATRVKMTLEGMNKNLNLSSQKFDHKYRLYEASRHDWLEEIHQLPSEVNAVLLAGHNPSLSSLVSLFEGRNTDLSPCELYGYSFDVDSWDQIRDKGTRIIHLLPD